VPFPPLPARLVDAFGPGGLRLRRFGTAPPDLELDFDGPVPELVTEIISCCAERRDGTAPDRRRVAELSVSARIVCLLLLAGLEGVETLTATLACPAAGCGERFEVDLTLDEVLAFARTDADEPFTVELDGALVSFRRPTGSDQLAWRGAHFRDAPAARLAVLRTLALSDLPPDLAEAQLATIEAALDEHDPLVRFGLTAACPACETQAVHEVALADIALQVLRGAQSRLVETVHVLASRYGWGEAAVLGIPAWRRQRYLSLIGTAGA
jgi:hypothetical protein